MAAMRTTYRRPAIIGVLALAALFGGTGAWASRTEIAGAVIASGEVVVKGKPKLIQHLDGGVVEAINVEAGDRVEAGDVLIEIDDTTTAANLAIYRTRLRDALVRKRRLLAELEGETAIGEVDPAVVAEHGLGSLDAAREQQLALMRARAETQTGKLAQFDERIAQFGNQIEGVEGLMAERENQIAVYDEEIAVQDRLVKRKLSQRSQLMALQRERADLRGQMAENVAEIARLRNSISEARISKLQVAREFREAIMTEIEETDARIKEMAQQIDATRRQLERSAIVAPVSGIVHEMLVHTIGGVVSPGQAVMQIVPQDGELDLEVNVDTQSVDQLRLGQYARVRLPAFHQRSTPELDGEVAMISASSVLDERTGLSFYRVLLRLKEGEIDRLGDKRLVPGMPVEALLPTENRTVLSYLTRPLTDNLARTFREE